MRFNALAHALARPFCLGSSRTPVTEPCLERSTRRLIALGAILAPALHSLTDVQEWVHGGFFPVQLWLNYLAFLPVPAVMLGLYAAQRPRISRLGLVGALLYGFAFVYFTHTTLLALVLATKTYADLWKHLGAIYTLHGVLMIVGGACFGWASLRAGVLPRWTATTFLLGVSINLLLGVLPAPELLQTIGTAVRNAGLIGMGWAVSSDPHPPRGKDSLSPLTSPQGAVGGIAGSSASSLAGPLMARVNGSVGPVAATPPLPSPLHHGPRRQDQRRRQGKRRQAPGRRG